MEWKYEVWVEFKIDAVDSFLQDLPLLNICTDAVRASSEERKTFS